MMQNSITWAVVAIIGFLVIAEIFEDPKVKAMKECTRFATNEEKIECASVIFGDE